MNEQRKNMVVDFYRFFELYCIRSENRDAAPPAKIHPIDAEYIKIVDAKEEYVHVQEFEMDGITPLKQPLVWWINSWRSCFLKYQLDKARYAAERKEANLLVENRDRVAKAMAKEYGLTEDIFKGIALKIAKKKIDKAAEHYKTTIDRG